MPVRSDDIAQLHSVVWQAWDCVCGTRESIDPAATPVGFSPCEAAYVIAEHGLVKGTPPEPDGEVLESLVEVFRKSGRPITPELAAGLRKTAAIFTSMGMRGRGDD
jgi:hypothetical protein